MNIDGSDLKLVSTGKGKTTCAYFLPGDTEIIYSSTHHINEKCPPKPDYSKGYVWKLDDYDIFKAKADGSNLRQLTNTPGYDAEATVSPKGDKIVFTSMRDGDLEIYTMDLDGRNIKRLTFEKGYDGGAFFSWDGKKICYRAYHPKDSAEIAEYEQLLKDRYIKPMKLHIFVMDADGKNKSEITTKARKVNVLMGAFFICVLGLFLKLNFRCLLRLFSRFEIRSFSEAKHSCNYIYRESSYIGIILLYNFVISSSFNGYSIFSSF